MNPRRRLFVRSAIALTVWGVVLFSVSHATEQPTAARVLIVTGEDPVHDWRATTEALRQLLAADPRLRIDVHAKLATLHQVDFAPYGAVVVNFKNSQRDVPGREAFERLQAYVRGGGGLVLVHFACGAFEEYKPQYADMVGRVWFGLDPPPGRRQHDPRGPFQVLVRADHPVTSGMSDFGTDDELYTCLEGDLPVEVVAAALSPVDGIRYPMAMVRHYGDGRVFNCTLGHDVRALQTPGAAELYRRGCAWSARLSPTPQGTSDLPADGDSLTPAHRKQALP